MNERRYNAACTVFDGKIVVSGGEQDWGILKSVEAYDYYEDKWTFYASMIERRYGHSAVSLGNKMFVIEKLTVWNRMGSEVYNSVTKQFSKIKSPNFDFTCNLENNLYCIGEKLMLFGEWSGKSVKYFVYDVKEDNWSIEETQFEL